MNGIPVEMFGNQEVTMPGRAPPGVVKPACVDRAVLGTGKCRFKSISAELAGLVKCGCWTSWSDDGICRFERG